MKTEFVDVNETRKNLVVEIDSTTVDAEIDKIARDYGKAARIPGFRPGKVPSKVVRQRFRDQILHDVAHGLIPRAVDDYLDLIRQYRETEEDAKKLENPVWHVHAGNPPAERYPVSFALLLAAASGAPFVPVALGGTLEAWPPDRKVPRPRPVSRRAHPIRSRRSASARCRGARHRRCDRTGC